MQGRVGLTSGAMHIFFVQVLSFVLLLSMWLGLNGAAQAATSEWVDVSASADIYTSNPLRSRRSPDATVTVNVTNTSGAVLDAPLRLVLSQFTPSSVSLEGASGTTSAGDPYLNLSSALAAGESSGNITLKILGGGTTSFNFVPVLEQEQTSTPDPLTIQILDPKTLITVGVSPIAVTGSVSDDTATLTLNGATVNASNGQFSALVSLEEGLNTVVARAVRAGEETTDSIVVSLDATPPYLTIEAPADGSTVYTPTISVSGLVNDIVRGTVSEGEANVTVNGVVATVSNRSYLAEGISLIEGENTITVQGSDDVGNVGETSITVHYEVPKPKRIELVSGQNQQGTILTQLGESLIVKLIDSDGSPAVDKSVVFRVIQGDGLLAPGTTEEAQGILVKSDSAGTAEVAFKLGSRAGNGNHRVRARAVGFDSEVVFHASATTNAGDKVSIIDGNNQRGAINQPLSKPLIVAVTDHGANLVASAEVLFEVTNGGGKFQNGLSTYTTTTDTDGRASAELTLGPDVGMDVQRVTASLSGTSAIAGFTASGLEIGDPGQTSITGVVLDNQDNPVTGVTVRVEGTARQAVADAEGQFTITEVPVGPVHLIADGSTATVEGEWPTLSYNLVTVAGAVNPLSAPIYLVKLNTENAKWVGKEDVELTLDELPGFKLTVKADSVTFPNGEKEGFLSVTPVNANKVPMPPPNGMQPQVIVTIQPAGAKFDPPAPLTLPNVDAHAPGAQVEMYSYDHDLEEFVAIGLGTVTSDGSLIESNTGVGVIKAGWHCGSQPGGSGCCEKGKKCGYCYNKTGGCPSGCSFVASRPAKNQVKGNCRTELCSGSKPNDGDKPPEECGTCKNGQPDIDETKPLGADKQKPDDCKELLCGGGFNPKDETSALKAADSKNECKKCNNGNIDNDEDGLKCGDGSESQACYTCKNGNCGNHCEADPETHTFEHTAPDFVLNALTSFPEPLKKVYWFHASLSPFIGASMTAGEHCCKDCSTPEPKPYKKFTGNAGVKGDIKVSHPWAGGNFEMPPKTFSGYAFKAEVFVTLLGAAITVDAKGEVNYTATECPDENCGGFDLGANLSGSFGPQVDGTLKLVSCSDAKCKDDVTILAATGKGGGTLNVKGFIGGKWSSGAQCGSSCIGGVLEPVVFAASFSISIEIVFKKYTYSATMDPLEVYSGTSFGPGC